jgi:predicted CoA-substrate-specific enzyme activase
MNFEEVFNENRIAEVTEKTVVGIDIGSRQSKAVLLYNHEVFTALIPTGFFMQDTAEMLLSRLYEQSGISEQNLDFIVSTGYGRIALSFDTVPSRIVTEISCHGMGGWYLGEDIHTIIDIGGQDSKVIRIDPNTGTVMNFAMNDKCAAGTGRFLEEIAKVLGVDATQIGEISLQADRPTEISSQCIVFAESEVVSGRAKGEKVENLAAGIHTSVAKRINGLMNRVGIEPNVLFTGGVSNNQGMRKAFEELLGITIAPTKINTVFAGALGAALFAGKFAEECLESQEQKLSESIDLTSLEDAIVSQKETFIKKTTGKSKNVASLCAYTPIELLESADVAHTRFMHAGTAQELAAGELRTQSAFCDMTKSILGEFEEKNPYNLAVDHVFTFYTCDCMRKTAEAIGVNYVPTTQYNLPRSKYNLDSEEYFATEIEAFRKDLEKLTRKSILNDVIVQNIDKYNEARKTLRQISAYRKEKDPLITGSDFQRIAQAYYYLPVQELLNELNKIESQLKEKKPGKQRRVRLMLAGSVIAEGDSKVTNIVEKELGARIVVEDNCTGYKQFTHEIKHTEKGPIYDLAKGYLNQAPCARMKPLNELVENTVELAKEYKVDGIIYRYMKFCPCYSIVIRKYLERFERLGIPVLVLQGDYSNGDNGQLKTRIEAFVDVLKERRID